MENHQKMNCAGDDWRDQKSLFMRACVEREINDVDPYPHAALDGTSSWMRIAWRVLIAVAAILLGTVVVINVR